MCINRGEANGSQETVGNALTRAIRLAFLLGAAVTVLFSFYFRNNNRKVWEVPEFWDTCDFIFGLLMILWEYTGSVFLVQTSE